MNIIVIFLILLSVVVAFASLGNMTQATAGVYTLAWACFFGILARMAQASSHNSEQKELMSRNQRELMQLAQQNERASEEGESP